MNAATQKNETFRSVLLVSGREGHLRVDRDFLKKARVFTPKCLPSADGALAFLAKNGADLVIADEVLADGTGLDLLRRVKADPRLSATPVIMTTLDKGKPAALAAIAAGCDGYLIRPYSLAAFFSHLELARQSALFATQQRADLAAGRLAAESGQAKAARAAFDQVLAGPDQAPRHFAEGMTHLAAGRLDPAIVAFNQAVTLNRLYAEAYLGLAQAWRAKGGERNYRKYLRQAAEVTLRARRFEELKERFVAALAGDQSGFNPFFAVGNEQLRARDHAGALASYRAALEFSPKNGDIFVEMAKAYHFLRRPDLAVKAVSKGLALQESNMTGQVLYRRLTGASHGDLEAAGRGPARTDAAGLPWPARLAFYLAGLVTEGLFKFRRAAA